MNLHVVATPIGNLSDCSPRAKEVLSSSTLIIAEDTRTTGQLLKLLNIEGDREYVSFHAQSSANATKKALDRCNNHENISLVTDAGTPTISDPGSLFVSEFRKSYPDANIIPIPGASAVISALSVSGFPASHFEFFGFIPHKKGRETLFKKIAELDHTSVFYESPHRIMKTLESLEKYANKKKIFVAREMTKKFEEYKIGYPKEILEYYSKNKDKIKGEFVIVVQ
jgi:16S rRNA (cytidine1402-2'-O)-methyltransferase